MIKGVLFDIGGTLHTVTNSVELRTAFARRLMDRLKIYDIHIDTPADELGLRLYENAEEYKHWSEQSLSEIPSVRIWNEYFLKQYNIGEARLAPIAEELSFLYDYDRVCIKRRPGMVETIETLHVMGLRLGIISNIISTSFVPHILKEYGVDTRMECVILSSEAGVRKPDPRIFSMALDEMRLNPEEAAYVGDTISRDVLGAKNANLGLIIQIKNPAIAHRDAGFGENAPRPDYLIENLDEIPAIISEYNKLK